MTQFHALILALVEGLTEFLPISSTGHMILTAELLRLQQTEFLKSFEIIIQLGAILAVLFVYWKKILYNHKIWKQILAAFIPTAVIGFILYKFIKTVLFGNPTVVLVALLVGGIVMILLDRRHNEKNARITSIEEMSVKDAVFIGLCQSISVVPGVSRAAATIIGGLLRGTKREVAVEFSFLLAIPTMMAATGLDILKSDLQFSNNEIMLLATGFIGSFIVALLAVKLFLKYIQSHTFFVFGVYRIFLAIVFWIFFLN